LAEVNLYPYTTLWLAEERRAELLRDAERWRLAHPIRIKATKRPRWWIRLLPWRQGPVRPARLMTIIRTSPGTDLPAGFPFSLAGEADGLCFVSGMPALDPEGKFVPGMFEEETELAWHKRRRHRRGLGLLSR